MRLNKNIKVGRKIVVTGSPKLSGKLLKVKKIACVKYLQPVSWVDGSELNENTYSIMEFKGLVYAYVFDKKEPVLKMLGNFFTKLLTYSNYSE